MTRIGMDYNI